MSSVGPRERGFTLVELAVVLAIVALLMGSLMYTLSAQTEQRHFEDTRRSLDQARELLLSYAVVNGRLPCPAICTDYPTCSAGGAESIASAAAGGGGTCTTYYDGYLPAQTIGFTPTDSNGYGLDGWNNRIRYAVSKTGSPHFTGTVKLKADGITTVPLDLDICKHLTATDQSNCGPTGDLSNRVVAEKTVAAVIWSQGKNYAGPGAVSTDEKNNNDAHEAFVSRTPTGSDSADGEFDDMLVWLPVGTLYGRMIAAGVLP